MEQAAERDFRGYDFRVGHGGFFGPTAVGWVKEYTSSFAGGLYALAGFSLLSAIVSAFWLKIPNPAAARNAEQEMAAAAE